MSLTPGARLGPYEVVSLLGSGGMGEVYRARDTTLDRDVALKILPESFASDPDRLMRFEREAKTLASVNHPNIAAIYGIEGDGGPSGVTEPRPLESPNVRALVMELVEGEDLSARIARGALELDDAVPIARQIAEALEAAHEAGVIHRDLKPANIKVKPDGTVKVLDFGLAKALDGGLRTQDSGLGTGAAADAATVTSPALTAMGLVLGTAAYMSPEQARGRPVDRRADIWAFGVVLYEILTGRRLFDPASDPGTPGARSGDDPDSVSDVIAAVLRSEINLSVLPASTPTSVRRLVARCLDRNPKTRLQHIGEARIALAGSVDEPVASETQPASASRQATPLAMALAAGLIVMTITAGYFALRPAPVSAPVISSRFELPVDASAPVWSDDGSQVAWLERDDDNRLAGRIRLRRVDELQIRDLDLGEGLRSRPAFSPDGEWLAYTHAPIGGAAIVTEIRKVRVTGGPSELVATVTAGNATTRAHLVWLGDRMFLALGHELLDVPAAGGTLRPVLTLPEDLRFQGNLQIINDGRDVLFSTSPAALWTVPMTGGEPRQVLGGVIGFRVTPTGHLLYTSVDETQLLGRAFREDTVEVAGDPVPLLELQFRGWDSFGISPNGMLALALDEAGSSEVVWVDRSTGQADLIHPDLSTSAFRLKLSPDGQFVLYIERPATSAGGRLRAWDIAQQRASVLADDVRQFGLVVRTQALVFSRGDSVFRLDFPWTSAPVPFSELRDQYRFWDATPDGRQLVVSRNSGSDWAVLNADGSGAPVPIEGLYSSFSPDGRWVAFSQGAVATAAELWVRPASVESKARWLVTEKAAVGWGFWSGDGREYFFSDRTGRWQSVTVRGDRPDAPFELGRIVPVNEPDDVILWDVTPDGSRFLARRTLPAAAPRRLAIVQNFFEELRAKVPVK